MNADWATVEPNQFSYLADQLSHGSEWEYTALTDRLLHPTRRTTVRQHGSALVLFDRGGFTFPLFPDWIDPSTLPPLPASTHAVGTIMGLRDNVDSFCRLQQLQPTEAVDYLLLHRRPAPIDLDIAVGSRQATAGEKVHTIRLTPQHHAQVLPLEIAYQQEEVILPGHTLHTRAISARLEGLLEEQFSAGVLLDETLIAKAHTNARGLGCCQIGGVFTVPRLRRQRYGELAMRALLQYLGAGQQHTSLFVKLHNTGGLSLYTRLGFTEAGRYKIAYC